MAERKRWAVVLLFSTAMAWMEAATVIYLRTLVGRLDPYTANPLPRVTSVEWVELVREVATMLLLASAAWLAGRNWRTRLGYFLLAFGVWDMLYYLFLALMIGWPRSLADWDVLFLIPLPWWAPVAAPALIALGMALLGTLITQSDAQPWPRRWAWTLTLIGAALALVVFTADARHALRGGEDAVRAALPIRFNWLLFALALALMSAALVDTLRQLRDKAEPQRRGAAEEAKTAD
jgi:hypothetical protein